MYSENFPEFDPTLSFADFPLDSPIGYHISGSSTTYAYFGRATVLGFDPRNGRLFVQMEDDRIGWFEQGSDQVLPLLDIPADLVR